MARSLRDLVELVRAPAALSVPGDVVAGRGRGRPGWARARRLAAPRSASTGPAWPPTTGPTATWTRVERPERPIPSGRVARRRARARRPV